MSELDFSQSSPFAEEFRAFVIAEQRVPPPRSAVLFYGSSSIRLWSTLEEDFAETPVVNHGFGGSTLADCVREMERLVVPVQPRAIVLYAGDNDLDQGATPEQVLALFRELVARVHRHLGAIPLIFISVKPSPARFWNIANIRRTNALLRDGVSAHRAAHFLDIFHIMLDANGGPRPELFTEDGLHMNRDGYSLWTSAVRGCLADLGLLPS